jgi:hypothetical protein
MKILVLEDHCSCLEPIYELCVRACARACVCACHLFYFEYEFIETE